MPLTPEDLKTLARPFRRADHSFLRGFVYLSEEAITARLEEVDPSWTFEILNVRYEGVQAIVTARMAVCGVYRDGVGMQKVIETAGEADKGAATDALKRSARLFGVGRYLLDAPKGSGEQGNTDFDNWLAKAQKEAGMGVPTPPTAENAPAPAQGQQQASRPPIDMDRAREQLGNGGSRRATDGDHTSKLPIEEDLTNKDTAADFIKATRGAGIADADVLAALGVTKLSHWTQGRKAAGEAVKAWQAGKLADNDDTTSHDQQKTYEAVKHLYETRNKAGVVNDAGTWKHVAATYNKLTREGVIRAGLSTDQVIAKLVAYKSGTPVEEMAKFANA